MNDNEVVASTILVNRSALRFLYVATLKQKWFDEEIARPKRRPTLPGILSAHEVTRILAGCGNTRETSYALNVLSV
jgi:site-specific recombinase XerD